MARRALFSDFAAFAALTLCSCVTPLHPDKGDAGLAAVSSGAEPVGYLAFTAGFDLQAFYGYPTIAFDLRNTATDEAVSLIVTPEEMDAFGKDRAYVPILYRLPPGRYEMTKSLIRVPGGSSGRRRFEPFDQPLTLEKHLDPFTVEAGKLLHLASARFKLAESRAGNQKFYQTSTEWRFEKPEAFVWQPFQALLLRTPSAYQTKTQNGAFATTPLTYDAAEFDPASSYAARSKVHGRITDAHTAAIRGCNARFSPKAHGKVVVRYVIAPDGHVDEASIKSTTLRQKATEDCIIDQFRAMTFPRPPGHALDPWESTWNL